MNIPKKFGLLLEKLYTTCCTLKSYREEHLLQCCRPRGISNEDYSQFLNEILVCHSITNTYNLPNDLRCKCDSLNKEEFLLLMNNLKFSPFQWNETDVPIMLPFCKGYYYHLYLDIGDLNFTRLFNKCALFAILPVDGNLWQIGGKPVIDNEQFAELQKSDLSMEKPEVDEKLLRYTTFPMERLKTDDLINWNKLIYNRNFKISCCNFINELSKKEWSMEVGMEITKAMWPNKFMNASNWTHLSPWINGKCLHNLLNQFLCRHKEFNFEASLRIRVSQSSEGVMPVDLKKVIRFARAIIFKVIPVELLGSRMNQVEFQKFVSYLLRLGLGDQPSVEHLLSKMNVEDCHSWLNMNTSSETSVIECCQLFLNLVVWMLNEYVLTCLSTFFYVTNFSDKQLFYYDKLSWRELEKNAINKYAESGIIRQLANSEAEMMLEFHNFNYKNIRFVPKKLPTVELRPILKDRGITDMEKKRQMKKDLSILSYVLCDEKYRGCNIAQLGTNNETFGSIWKNYVLKLKKLDISQLYFIRLDIKDCFPNINHDKLFEILTSLANDPKYRFKELWLRPYFILQKFNDKPKYRYKRIVGVPHQSFAEKCKLICGKKSKKIIVNLNRVESEEISKVVKRTIDEVSRNVFKFNGRYYLQKNGLTQGGMKSQVLCNMYLGHMEYQYLQEFLKKNESELLVRYVDDYLFVTPDRARAEQFKVTLDKGLTDFNALLNHDKSATNFECDWSQNVSNVLTYCGLKINTSTLNISTAGSGFERKRLDFGFNVYASKGLAPIITLLNRNACLNNRLFLFDGELLSRQIIISNMYKFFYMIIIKLYCALARLPTSRRQMLRNDPEKICEAICKCIESIQFQIGVKRKQRELNFPFKLCIIKWICLQAAFNKFKRHQEQYRLMVKNIRDMLFDVEKQLKLSKKKKKFYTKRFKLF